MNTGRYFYGFGCGGLYFLYRVPTGILQMELVVFFSNVQSKCNGLSFGCFFINCTVQSISNAFYCIFKEFLVSNVHVTFVQYYVICLQSAQYSIVYMYYSRIETVCIYVVRP